MNEKEKLKLMVSEYKEEYYNKYCYIPPLRLVAENLEIKFSKLKNIEYD
jgi:hypothetical protein